MIRRGAYSNTQYHIKETYKLKEYFDSLLGYNLYDLFPEIKDNLQEEIMKIAIVERIENYDEEKPFNKRYYLDSCFSEIFDELDILLIPVISEKNLAVSYTHLN